FASYHDVCCLSHVHVAVRGLHSVPTRRSSDLILAVGAAVLVRARGGEAIVAAREVLEPDLAHREGKEVVARVGRWAPADESVSRDRKSTRLNSSHDQISYAVFCLKKKNGRPDL